MSDLLVLIPDRTFATSHGPVTLTPFALRNFKTALGIIERYVNVFMVSQTGAEMAEKIFARVNEDYAILDDIQALLTLVIKPSIELEDLRYDEVIGLLAEVIQMNLDFFKQIGERLNKMADEPKAE